MNILTFSENIQSQLHDQLENTNASGDDLIKLGSCLRLINQSILELKQFTASYQFNDQREEIMFFKQAKPILISQHVYYKKMFEIKLFNSFRDIKSRQTNYSKILDRMETFVRKNRNFYEYCITNATELDELYFTRNQSHLSFNVDTKFTTGYDIKLGKILGFELIKKYITEQLQRGAEWNQPALTWTGSKTDLTELIYALQTTNVFNNGTADVKLIANTLCGMFNVNIGNIYKVFQEIRLRKREQIPFMETLKKKLLSRIEEKDS